MIQRDLLAIGGISLTLDRYAKVHTFSRRNRKCQHIIPSKTSRIAVLQLPELSAYNYAPFVQLHYNADLEGSEFTTSATSRLTANKAAVIPYSHFRVSSHSDMTVKKYLPSNQNW